MNSDVSPAAAGARGPAAVRDYYAAPTVRARIVEFLGGSSLAEVTCRFIAAEDPVAPNRDPRPASDLLACLEEGRDVSRALWDRASLLAHLDVEYVNFDHPAEAYLHPRRTFGLLEPVDGAITALLAECGLTPLRVLSGRGFHYAWRVALEAPVLDDLATIGRGPPSLARIDAQPHRPHGETIPARLGAAFAGLGLLMEFLAHRVKESAAARCAIPVELTAVEVGPRGGDREMVSVDISEYGDPLHSRMLRAPFSIYHKPAQQRWLLGEETLRAVPPIFFLPLAGLSVREALELRHDPRRVAALAAHVSTAIPEQAAGTARLLAAYRASRLAAFHRHFYAQEQHPPERWSETYDRTPLEVLPACGRHLLTCPNDLLLHPASMRLLTRCLLALGWHPRHIAGLICSKFARDFGWGGQWAECDPATRADFYTRVFAGLFVAGCDDLTDFNCQSAHEEGICPAPQCAGNLEPFQHSALARRSYDQLAHRPFNRLFSPREHP